MCACTAHVLAECLFMYVVPPQCDVDIQDEVRSMCKVLATGSQEYSHCN